MKHKIVNLLILASVAYCTVSEAKPDKAKPLPPGLEKKMARTGQLPPGWQKKLLVGERLDKQVYQNSTVVVPVTQDGTITVEIGGRIVRLIEATREIVDILK